MITISPATQAQLSIVRTIAYQTWPATFGAILSPEQIEYMLAMMYSPDALLTQTTSKNHVFLLASAPPTDEYLGFVSYEFDYQGGSATKIHKLYLLPASQGKGAGRQLIDYVADLARHHGNDRLSLNVNRHNKAFQFYERLGFSTVHQETIDIGNGYVMDDFVMEKPLLPNGSLSGVQDTTSANP